MCSLGGGTPDYAMRERGYNCGGGHMHTGTDPHAEQPVLRRGPRPREARIAIVLVHGRGADAASILTPFTEELHAGDILFVAPQAAANTWYPYSFLEPIPKNEPGLSSALRQIERIIGGLTAEGIPAERVGLMGFSQGACLALEYAARHARRYAGVAGLSGGLIGPPGTPRDYAGTLEDTPVFLGCSDIDAHIPLARVHETAVVFRNLGARVDERIYPGMGHTINTDEISAVRKIFSA
jgi:predicted esterase